MDLDASVCHVFVASTVSLGTLANDDRMCSQALSRNGRVNHAAVINGFGFAADDIFIHTDMADKEDFHWSVPGCQRVKSHRNGTERNPDR
jgi:hypothetical protein